MTTIDTLTAVQQSPDLTQVARRTYDWDTVDPNTAVAEVLAETKNCEPDDIGPLYGLFNTDALDSFRHREPHHTTAVTVSFQYEGLLVSVESTGEIAVYRADGKA